MPPSSTCCCWLLLVAAALYVRVLHPARCRCAPSLLSTMQWSLLLLSTLCTASVAFRFAPPRTPLSTKSNLGLAPSSCQTHVVGHRKRVAAGGWQARAVGNDPRRTIFRSSGGGVQEDEVSLDCSGPFGIGILIQQYRESRVVSRCISC